ncbi:MAG: phosphoribosyltransferase family protein [Thermoplasmata archaeon]|jgi:predicted phosphoribosyltransferase
MASDLTTPGELEDREDAGRRLAQLLLPYRRTNALVLALPRGGVVVAAPIAERLELPLEVLIVRKIGHPAQPEFGLGAVVEGLPPVLDTDGMIRAGISEAELAPMIRTEQREVERRARRYRGGRLLPDIRGRVVLLVDDGIATGGTVRSAIKALRQRRPQKIVLAVGVAPPDTYESLRKEVDELVCLSVPTDFAAVGQFYREFQPVSDDRVIELLNRFQRAGPAP